MKQTYSFVYLDGKIVDYNKAKKILRKRHKKDKFKNSSKS